MIMDRTMKLKAAGFISLIVLTYISISWTLIILFLGLLLIPPIAVTVYLFIHGIPLLEKEIKDLLIYGKDFFLISVSRDNIILEPQFR